MHDRDLRLALLADLHRSVLPDTRIVEELGIRYGDRRVDVAVINGEIHGYELKSDLDDLSRLPSQAEVYGTVLDRATLVASPRHLAAAEKLIPGWWGVTVAEPTADIVVLVEVRPARANLDRQALALAQLLWRDEAMALLDAHGLCSGLARAPRRVLLEVLAREVALADLSDGVRAALKRRENWRVVDTPK